MNVSLNKGYGNKKIKKMEKDFLGSNISIGDFGLRVHASGHTKNFVKIQVQSIDKTRKYGDTIGIISDGGSKIGWTYPSRILVQPSLNIEIKMRYGKRNK